MFTQTVLISLRCFQEQTSLSNKLTVFAPLSCKQVHRASSPDQKLWEDLGGQGQLVSLSTWQADKPSRPTQPSVPARLAWPLPWEPDLVCVVLAFTPTTQAPKTFSEGSQEIEGYSWKVKTSGCNCCLHLRLLLN